MHLQNQLYTITASVETMPPLSKFDIVHNPHNTNTDDFFMARVFKITSTGGTFKTIALIDLLCTGHKHYAVLANHLLTVILFQSIVRIDLTTGMITQFKECDTIGGLFEIHTIKDGYIIWGEGDIFRYDRNLNQIWHYIGRDILVSPDNDKHFWIEDSLIHCRDFLGWHYILNFDGILLSDFQETEDSI